MERNESEGNLRMMAVSSTFSLKELIEAASKFDDAQIFDSDSIASEKQLRLAFFHARESFKEKSNLAKSFKMEFLLRAAATRQIKVAIERCGVKNPSKVILAVWKGDENKVLPELKAQEVKWEIDENRLMLLYGLDKEKDLEKQIIKKMVEVQIED